MVIQCSSCQTKYRLNLERIPARRTFVKCRKCGTPIYVDPPPEAEVSDAVIPPEADPGEAAASAEPAPPGNGGEPAGPAAPAEGSESGADTAAAEPGVSAGDGLRESETAGAAPSPAAPPEPSPERAESVSCPSCDTRYRLPPQAFERPDVRLKCSRCGHQFALADAVAAETVGRAAGHRPDFYPAAEERPPAEERPMPVPDESQLDGMFDDLRDQASPFGARRPAPPPPDGEELTISVGPPRADGAPAAPPELEVAAEPPPVAAPPEELAEPESVAEPSVADVDEAQVGSAMAAGAKPAGLESAGAAPPSEAAEGSAPAGAELFDADLERIGENAAFSAEGAGEADPEQAYLEAVSFDDEEAPRRRPRGTVPDQYKYRFFLKPGSRPSGQEQPGADLQRAEGGAGPAVSEIAPAAPGGGAAAEAEDLDVGEADLGAEPAFPAPAAEAGVDAALDSAQVAPGAVADEEVDDLLQAHGVGGIGEEPTLEEDRSLPPIPPVERPPQESAPGLGVRLAPWLLGLAGAAVLVLLFLAGYALG